MAPAARRSWQVLPNWFEVKRFYGEESVKDCEVSNQEIQAILQKLHQSNMNVTSWDILEAYSSFNFPRFTIFKSSLHKSGFALECLTKVVLRISKGSSSSSSWSLKCSQDTVLEFTQGTPPGPPSAVRRR